jgi:hypothetical protein
MAHRLFIGFYLLFILLPGCDQGNPPVPSPQINSQYSAIILVDDLSAAGLAADKAQITSAVVAKDLLTLVVRYGGGCAQHEFKLFGSKRLLESYPPQADIILSHNANGDACKALIIDSLRFSLATLREFYQVSYGSRGTLLLRIHEPGAAAPLSPLIRYEF